jgi:hypothetical protein
MEELFPCWMNVYRLYQYNAERPSDPVIDDTLVSSLILELIRICFPNSCLENARRTRCPIIPSNCHLYVRPILRCMEGAPTVTILLLGDSDCGKSTFLAYVSSSRLLPAKHEKVCD